MKLRIIDDKQKHHSCKQNILIVLQYVSYEHYRVSCFITFHEDHPPHSQHHPRLPKVHVYISWPPSRNTTAKLTCLVFQILILRRTDFDGLVSLKFIIHSLESVVVSSKAMNIVSVQLHFIIIDIIIVNMYCHFSCSTPFSAAS